MTRPPRRAPRVRRGALADARPSCSPHPCAGRDRRRCGVRWRCAGPDGRRRRGARLTDVGDLLGTCRATAARRGRWRRWRRASRRRWPSRSARSPPGRCAGAACDRSSRRSCSTRPASMRAVFFNQPWLVTRYPAGHAARAARQGRGGAPLPRRGTTRSARRSPTAIHRGRRRRARRPLPGERGNHLDADPRARAAQRAALEHVIEPLPARLRAAERLADRVAALAATHFPQRRRGRAGPRAAGLRRAAARPAAVPAPPRASARRARRPGPRRAARRSARAGARRCRSRSPAIRRAAIAEIDAELAATRPMQRLLMGEVGSGKTAVALHAMLRAIEHGYQAALMAPTETLAEQHFATVHALMGAEPVPSRAADRLDAGAPARRHRSASSRAGSCRSIVGTHALIEPNVTLPRARRRRGRRAAPLRRATARRARRQGRRRGPGGRAPHVLHMTATPIPRTLALAALRRSRRDRAARAAPGTPADPHRDRRRRRRARARLRAPARAAARRAPGVRRLPARRAGRARR